MPERTTIRPATPEDLPAAAELASRLVRMHHAADPERFFLPDRVEEGYAWWLGRELGRAEAAVLVAVRDGIVVGYAYGTLEERDWNMLLEAHGAVHDVFVSEAARTSGVGRRLLESLIAELEARGAKIIVLATMVDNTSAQRLFRSCGFRSTMIEMTRGARPSIHS